MDTKMNTKMNTKILKHMNIEKLPNSRFKCPYCKKIKTFKTKKNCIFHIKKYHKKPHQKIHQEQSEKTNKIPKILIELTICGKTEIKDEIAEDIYKKMNNLLKKYTC